MRKQTRTMPTIGVLVGWSVYLEHSEPAGYLGYLLRGIDSASREQNCNLLLACGMLTAHEINSWRSSWPVISPNVDFIPVGTFNTDGLIVVLPLLGNQEEYIEEVLKPNHPVVFVGQKQGYASVSIDNVNGIYQAVSHLAHHGHRRIGFIAGYETDMSDSRDRLLAYKAAVQELGLDNNEDLIVYGDHTEAGGQMAMEQLLQSYSQVTAVVASNDISAIGAMEIVRKHHLRIPDDIAIIGFDDAPEAKIATPPLTSIHAPTFDLGWNAVELILQIINDQAEIETTKSLSTQLIVRESCGCRPHHKVLLPELTVKANYKQTINEIVSQFTYASMRAMFSEVAASDHETFYNLCHQLVTSYINDVLLGTTSFQDALSNVLQQEKIVGGDIHGWHLAILTLEENLPALVNIYVPTMSRAEMLQLLHEAHITISENVRRQHYKQINQTVIPYEVRRLTARLLSTVDERQAIELLNKSSAQLGIENIYVVLYEGDHDDHVAWSTVLGTNNPALQRFPTCVFPPPELYPDGTSFQLALLPLIFGDKNIVSGFVVFEARHPIPYAATIVQHLSIALRTSQLYQQAIRGYRLAEEANKLKSRFLSIVSHELRTPLSLIIGLTEILGEQAKLNLPLSEISRQDIEQIQASAQQLDGLIRDVLDLTSSHVGQLKLICEPLNLIDVLQPVILTGQGLTSTKGIEWVNQLPPAKDIPLIWGDRTRLRQVGFNLVKNAIKFTQQGCITVSLQVNERSVTFMIKDTGVGVPIKEQEAIFDEFRQSERTAIRGYSGLGLGLAICKQIVELHGGTISVVSSGEEGTGSTFSVTLPILNTHSISQFHTALEDIDQEIVLVSHSTTNIEHVAMYFNTQGFHVTKYIFSDLDNWIEYLNSASLGVLILEKSVANEHGWEILRTVKQNLLTQHIPVLFYASEDQLKTNTFLELEYLTKPLAITELASKLQKYGLFTNDEIGKTVLIVDDDPNILAMHTRMLQKYGVTHRILNANDGREAITILQKQKVNLVLLDLMMPDMDGFAVIEAMQQNVKTRNIPVVVLTAQILSEVDMARLNRGVASILSKGIFTQEETLKQVKIVLSRTHQLGAQTQRLVREAMAFIHTHYAEPITRDDIAKHIAVSQDYLSHCFQKELNLSPITYLNRYRINQAKILLEETVQSITEIAEKVGFSSDVYFIRVFRREVGMTPRTFRQSRRASS